MSSSREPRGPGPRPVPARGDAAGSRGDAAALAARDERDAERAAWALWGTLVVLALARVVTSLIPGMAAWGFNIGRFLPAAVAWTMAALLVIPLAPDAGRWLTAPFDRLGQALARTPRITGVALALGVALLVWLASDRAWLVGDFQIRLGAARASVPTDYLFPQALPLDLFLHHTVPSSLARRFGWDPDVVERVLGALEAGGLAYVCAQLPSVLRLTGVAATTATAVALFGGFLCMFTGYGKAFRELCLLVAITVVYGLRALEEERAAVGPAFAAALGFVLHRSSVIFLLPLLALLALGAQRGHAPPRRRGIAIAASAALVVMAVMAPRTIAVFRAVDRVHFEPLGAGRTAVGALADPVHLLDVVSVVAQLVPLAFALPFLVPPIVGRRRREAIVLAAMVVPVVSVLLLIHPRQGAFRDWDVFAASGVGLAIAAAWAAGRVLERAPRLGWVGVAACAGVIVPALGWLVHFHSTDAALHRVETYLAEPPARPDPERAPLCEYLGLRYSSLERWDDAADAYARAVQAAPSPRMRYEWAESEATRGRLRESERILLDLTGIAPQMALAWSALAQVSLRLGNLPQAREAAVHALERSPDDPGARMVMQELARAAAADTSSRR